MEMFNCTVTPKAIELVTEVLRSRRLSEGPMVKRFEDALSEQLGLSNPVAVNSGTTAIELALRLAGVGPGDRVILPAVTFVATGVAVLHCGATPIFADVDPETGNIDPQSIESSWALDDPSIKVIIAVHWAGLPADLDAIGLVTASHSVCLVEDAAHALGADLGMFVIGSHPASDFTAFSLQATKGLTSGDGGVLCSARKADIIRAKRLRWFGIDRDLPVDPSGERDFGDVPEVGGKWHLNDLAAAVGLGNLDGFKDRLWRRQEIALRYMDHLENVPGVHLLACLPDRESACYVFSMRVERRVDFQRAMASRGVPTSIIASRIDRYKVFGGRRDDLPGTDVFDAEHVALCCHSDLTDDDVGLVVKSVREGW